MPVTIKDIAKRVGVSPSTVSRVLNGNTRISEETTKLIHEAMEELNYHPNSLARNFANGIAYSVGLIIDAQDENTFANAFFNRSVFAIEKVLQENGYSMVITNDRKKKDKTMVENLMLEKKVDGIIMPSSIVRPVLIRKLKRDGFPFVIMGEPKVCKDETDWIDIDNEQGSRLAFNHLISQGYRRIALVTEICDTVFAQNRLNGYMDSITEHNMELFADYIVEIGSDVAADMRKVEALLRHENPPDAFLCGNNILAFNVIKTLKNINKKVPEEIGVVTFDNYPIAEFTDPPMTVVDVDTYNLGIQVANQLLHKIQGNHREVRHEYIQTKLIIRRSSLKGEM